MGYFGLWRRFPFGAFGDDHLDRRDLVPVALAQAQAAGLGDVAAARTVIIGDTPLDVDCARTHGARALAVTTGHYSAEALSAAGADLVVPTLEDTQAVDRLDDARSALSTSSATRDWLPAESASASAPVPASSSHR